VAEIVMPRLSDSMEEGTILRWLIEEGDPVRRGDELVEIETDKATMTYESDADGILEIVAAPGETLPIGTVIARLDGGDAVSPAPLVAEVAPAPAGPAAAAAPVASAPEADGGRVRASPVAKRIATDRGVDLQSLHGSGPGGRIVRADVEAASPAPAPQAAPVAAGGSAKGEVTVQELTRTQGVIARRMAESKATIPDFELRMGVDAGAMVELRDQMRAQLPEGQSSPSLNDLVVKACALALREHPRANGSYRDGRFELFSRVNVGVAVAADDALVVPTIFDADRKPLSDIAAETRALAEEVRAGTVTPPELAGGTFTVSNLGMYGVTGFTAVINPPQAAILAVGAVVERAVVRDGAVVPGRTMELTLACDHRILYGAEAALFLARVRELLEAPLRLVVES
jgi:pyruvate dehydrogenase E2 component (dihydrolipoamide acetyltransferase)